jgi:hypothetical protein
MPDYPSSCQPGNGSKKMQMTDQSCTGKGAQSAPECYGTGLRCQNANAGGISLDIDAQVFLV